MPSLVSTVIHIFCLYSILYNNIFTVFVAKLVQLYSFHEFRILSSNSLLRSLGGQEEQHM